MRHMIGRVKKVVVTQGSNRQQSQRKPRLMATPTFPVQTSNWTLLIDLIGKEPARGFVFVGNFGDIMVYRHHMTRQYLNIHISTGQTFEYAGDLGYLPITKEMAIASA